MLGLFATLNMGARAMSAQQTAVEVTGQNLANVNNPAYARQRVNFETSVTVPTPAGPQGTGVTVASIQQLRDVLLDGQINAELSVSNYWSTQQGALSNTQTQLGEFLGTTVDGTSGTSASGTSLSTQLNNLFNSFQSVAANPSSSTQRQALVNQAITLTVNFNQASQRLDSVNRNLNQSITNDVGSANQLLADVADLNGQIMRAEAGVGTANDLRDLRQQKLEELSKLVNFETSEQADGSVSVIFNGNAYFVDGTTVQDSFVASDPGTGQLILTNSNSGLPIPMTGGSIQGAIDVRDGALQDLRTNLDTLASTLITQVNSTYATLTGVSGATFFTGTDAASIDVNSALQSDPSLFQAGVAGAPGDNSVALALGRLGQQTQAVLGNKTFSDAYAGIVADLGNDLAATNDQVTSNTAVTNMLLKQRDSVSGVSLDEEMTNLITFQKAYMASARIITTVDQMLDTVVNLKR